MFVARVVGNVWATRKHPLLEGRKLMLVEPVDGFTGKPCGETQLAIDHASGSGRGDTVLVLDEGSSCRQILGVGSGPVRTIIAGVIDTLGGSGKFRKFH